MWPHCYVHQRLSFVRNAGSGEGTELRWLSGGQNPHGSVIVYMGPALQTFVRVFSTIGSIPGANAWAHVDENGASEVQGHIAMQHDAQANIWHINGEAQADMKPEG